MTAEDLDLLREKILVQCRASGLFGSPVATLLRGCQRAGYDDLSLANLERELRHLQSAGLIQPVDRAALTPALARYQTTHAGDHELERRGLLP